MAAGTKITLLVVVVLVVATGVYWATVGAETPTGSGSDTAPGESSQPSTEGTETGTGHEATRAAPPPTITAPVLDNRAAQRDSSPPSRGGAFDGPSISDADPTSVDLDLPDEDTTVGARLGPRPPVVPGAPADPGKDLPSSGATGLPASDPDPNDPPTTPKDDDPADGSAAGPAGPAPEGGSTDPAPASEEGTDTGPETGDDTGDDGTPAAPGGADPDPAGGDPPPVERVTPPRAPSFTEYSVEDGDTMSSIAEMWFGEPGKWDLIAKANPYVDPARLTIGQVLRLPPKDTRREAPPRQRPVGAEGSTYTVRSGDSLTAIARNWYSDASRWRVIYDANRELIGEDPAALKVGMVLKIPPAG